MENKYKQGEPSKNGGPVEYPIIGKSKATEQLLKQISKLAKTRRDVLVVGESGVGKGAVSRNIFVQSLKDSPAQALTVINLAVADDRELDSILYGIDGGLESVSKGSRKGLLETNGLITVLVEEIEEASFRTQMKILNFIDERNRHLEQGDGGADIRFVITVKTDPNLLVEKRKLLDDLQTRLSDFEAIQIPPLRQRPEDIPMMVKHFSNELCKELGMSELAIDINAIDVLVRQPWRENIRELKAVVDKSVMFSNEGRFMLPPELVDEKTEVMKMINNILAGQEFVLDNSLDIIEKGIIERALERFGFNQSRAAQFLGMTEQTFRYKLKRLGIASARMRA